MNSRVVQLRAPKSRGDWMQTYRGDAFFPATPKPEDVHVEDIAHALGMQCRYGGQCERHYSVAEHSYWVSLLVPPEHALQALMHDSAEGYLVDVPRPSKILMNDYRVVEERVWRAICARYDLSPVLHFSIHDADNGICFSERDQNMKRSPYPWRIPDPNYRIKLGLWSNRRAEKMFLRRWKQLRGLPLTLWDRITLKFNNKKLLKETSNAPHRYSWAG